MNVRETTTILDIENILESGYNRKIIKRDGQQKL